MLKGAREKEITKRSNNKTGINFFKNNHGKK